MPTHLGITRNGGVLGRRLWVRSHAQSPEMPYVYVEVSDRVPAVLRRASTKHVAVPVTAAVVAVAITMAWLNWHADTARDPSPASPSSSASASTTRPGPSLEASKLDAMEVLVMGDSSAAGPVDGTPEWPDILAEQHGWHLAKDVVIMSGYLAAGRGRPFLPRMIDRLQAEMPELVLLAGGYADVRLEGVTAAEIVEGVDRVVTLVRRARPRAEVVIISPSASAEPGPRTVALAGALETYAGEERITYVDVTDVLVDPANRARAVGVRPSAAGHQKLAKVIDAALRHAVG